MSKRRLTGEAAVFAADLLWSDLVPDAAAREVKRQARNARRRAARKAAPKRFDLTKLLWGDLR